MNPFELFRPWIAAAAVLAAFVVGGAAVEFVLLGRLRRWADRTETQLDDLLMGALGHHVLLWFALGGLSAASEASPLGEGPRTVVHKAVVAGFFVSLTWVSSRFAQGAVRVFSKEYTPDSSTTSLTEQLVRVAILGMGAMLLLSNLGISITPVLTALGVGSLAVALALQDTLTNLFAGVHIVASRMVTVGDYVKLDGGQEGYVADVGWRATRIRELPNNLIIVPNSKLSQAVVTNYHQPERELAVLVQVGVSYDSDLEAVEKATIEVGREVLSGVAGGVPAFEPFIRYHTFADSSINFSVILRGKEFTDRYLLTHEFIKKLHRRYKKDGIEIPFPQRVVHAAP